MKVKAKDANEEVIEIEENDSASVELSEEDLASLKQLLSAAPQLMALIKTKDETVEQVGDEDEDKEVKDEDEKEVKDEKETKETKGNVKDSLASANAIHKKKSLSDSESLEDAVGDAWSKRYGGK